MKRMRFVVPFYDIDVILIQVESSKDAKAVERNLKPLDAPKEEVDEVMDAMRRSAYDGGETILDNTIGSGTTAVAAIREKRRFIGFELNKDYYDIACKRIKNEQQQLKLDF